MLGSRWVLLGRLPIAHRLVQPPPVQVHPQLPCLLVVEPMQLLVRLRPVDLSVGPSDEAVQRHSHRVDHLSHPGPPDATYNEYAGLGVELRAILLPGGVMPADLAYGALLEALGDDVQAIA